MSGNISLKTLIEGRRQFSAPGAGRRGVKCLTCGAYRGDTVVRRVQQPEDNEWGKTCVDLELFDMYPDTWSRPEKVVMTGANKCTFCADDGRIARKRDEK